MNILAIMAHPDDADLWCGGTLRKYYERGDKVSIVVMTNGRTGTFKDRDDNELISLRYDEQRNSAKIYGAEVSFLGFNDGELFDTVDSRRILINQIRTINPNIILTHNLKDQNSDHKTTAQMVTNALISLTLGNVFASAEPMKNTPSVFMIDTYAGIDHLPEAYVDISNQYQYKKEAMNCHKTQLVDGMQWMKLMDIQGYFRGMQSGYEYAEAFTAFKIFGSSYDYKLLP